MIRASAVKPGPIPCGEIHFPWSGMKNLIAGARALGTGFGLIVRLSLIHI